MTIYSYGLMLALAVITCAFFLQREARREGIASDIILDLVFWSVVSGLIGCRIFFVLLNIAYFIEHPSKIIMLHEGGLAWQGGLILGMTVAILLMKKFRLPLLKTLDLFAPYIALGQAIGRWGCFLNGCCYGKAVVWGIYFPVHQNHLHPTQLYSSFGLLAIFFILRRYRQKQKQQGQTFVFYLMFASILRFFVEFFRADHTEIAFGLSIFQIVAFCIFALTIYVHLYLRSRSGKQ